MIFSFCNFKGGVGRTTTTLNLGLGLARKGYKVLLIDLDPQANLTLSLGFFEGVGRGVYQVMRAAVDGNTKAFPEVVQSVHGLDLLPATLDLAAVDLEFANVTRREYLLQRALQRYAGRYDVIFCDTPPNISLLTANAIAMTDFVIIPSLSEYLAYKGIELFLLAYEKMKAAGLNDKAQIGGVLITRYDARAILTRETKEQIEERFGDLLFDTVIRPNIAIGEAQTLGMPIYDHAPESNGANDYSALSDEFITRFTNG